MFKVFITNMSSYVNCEPFGEWVELPMDESELRFIVNRILEKNASEIYQGYVIADHNCDFMDIDLYSDVFDLNNDAWELSELNEHDFKKVLALLEWKAFPNIHSCIKEMNNFVLYENIHNIFDINSLNQTELSMELSVIGNEYPIGELRLDGFFSRYGYIEEK